MTNEEKDIVMESVNRLLGLQSNILSSKVITGLNMKLLTKEIDIVTNNMWRLLREE